MDFDTHTNFSFGSVSVAPSPASSGTTLSLTNAEAALFPDPQATGNKAYNLVVWPANQTPISTNAEIVRVTAKGAADSGGAGHTQFTITRTQEGSSARSVQVGDWIANNITKKWISDIEAKTMPARTVGAKDADYLTDGTADEVQINLAISDANAAGGGIVYLKPGTYTIADLVRIKSNVHLIGAGRDFVTVKAVNNYTPTVNMYHDIDVGGTNPRHVLLQTYDPTTLTSNIEIKGITFDANGQNKAGLTSNSEHRAVNLIYVENCIFSENRVKNSVNWIVYVGRGTRVWIENNEVIGGWSTTYNQNDGIHVRQTQDCFIRGNYVSTNEGGTSGDDAIIAGSDEFSATPRDTANVVISNNIIKSSGSRGILLFVSGTALTRDVVVSNNIVTGTLSSGLLLQKIITNSGIFKNINIIGNTIYNFGDATHNADGIRADYTSSPYIVAFNQLSINNNIIRDSNNAGSGIGIAIKLKGIGLTINNNQISEIVGGRGIDLGDDSRPIKDMTLAGNRIDVSDGGSGVIGVWAYGTERTTIVSNEIRGHLTGTTYAVILRAKATAGNDANGVPNAETSAYNLVSNNQIYNFDNGIVEENAGVNPNNNKIVDNQFNTVTVPYVILGSVLPEPNLALADDSFAGTTVDLVAAESLVFGDVVYRNSTGKMAKADASAIATSSAIAIALGTIALDATGKFGLLGFVRDDSAYAFTVGGLIYLSITAGGITQTAPSATDEVIQILGVALTADVWYFKPQLVQVEHT